MGQEPILTRTPPQCARETDTLSGVLRTYLQAPPRSTVTQLLGPATQSGHQTGEGHPEQRRQSFSLRDV